MKAKHKFIWDYQSFIYEIEKSFKLVEIVFSDGVKGHLLTNNKVNFLYFKPVESNKIQVLRGAILTSNFEIEWTDELFNICILDLDDQELINQFHRDLIESRPNFALYLSLVNVYSNMEN